MKSGTKYFIAVAAVAVCVAIIAFGSRITQDPKEPAQIKEIAPIVQSTDETTDITPTPKQSVELIETKSSPKAEQVFKMSGNIVTLTLLGIDTSDERERLDMGWRSDSIAVMAIDMVQNKCTVITVPRDTRTKVRRLNKKGEVVSEKLNKVNAAYAFGGGEDKYSAENALYAISKLLGVDLIYYASLNIDAIAPLTDAVGGVELTLPADIEGVGKEGETVLLTGEVANRYVRARKGIQGGSDVARTKRQQEFIKQLAFKIKSMDAVSIMPKLLFSMGGKIKTNLSLEQMMMLASVLMKIEKDNLTFETIPGKGKTIGVTSFYIHNEEETKKLIRSVFEKQ